MTKTGPESVADAAAVAAGTFTLGPPIPHATPDATPASTVARATQGVDQDSAEGDTPATASASGPAGASGMAGSVSPISPIHAAKVVESMQGSEMRIGVRTTEFGNVSVSTLVNREQIAAQIAFDHGDLGKLIAVHLPTMQEKLGSDTGLHATVQVLDRGASYNQGNPGSHGSGAGAHSGAGGQSASGGQSSGSSASPARTAPAGPANGSSWTDRPPGESASRLDVRV